MSVSRLDFSEPDKKLLAERVGYHCSNPTCFVSTIGPSINPNEKEYIGVAAHIYPAADNGPRANPAITEEERINIEKNGIHLCSKCSNIIDKNRGRGYPPEILHQWKRNAEAIARKRIYRGEFINLYQSIEFTNLERQYSTALTCSGLGEKNVLSCPSYQPYIRDISTKLKLANKCIIKGDSGCGKTLLTYQIAKAFHDECWSVYKLNKNALVTGISIVTPRKKSLIIVDDAQTIDIPQLENVIEYSHEDCIVLLNWNFSASNNGGFLNSYPSIDIVSSQQVKMLTDYCINNKQHIANLLKEIGVNISDRFYFEMIETRIDRASKEKTPWLFNYSLTEGWKVAENDIKLLKDNERLDLVLVVVAAYQYATMDQGVSEDVIMAALREYCLELNWLNKAVETLKKYCISSDGLIRHKHYLYAKVVLNKYIASEKAGSCQDYVIVLFKRILADKNFEKGHSNILEFIRYDFDYCHYILGKDDFINKITEDLFSQPLISIPTKIQKLNSLIRFNKSVLSTIDNHLNVINEWIFKCDRDSAYPLGNLLNTLSNEKYKGLIVTNEMIEPLLEKLFGSNLNDKTRYSWLIDRLYPFAKEELKETFKNKIQQSGFTIDISKYPLGEEHYHFAKIITDLCYINEEWANDCVKANIDTIARNFNKDLMQSYELYKELIDSYFGVTRWMLHIKSRKSIRDSFAKTLAELIKIDAVLASLKTLELHKVQYFYTFLIFLLMYNKKALNEISKKVDYEHLKQMYQDDFKLDHEHECLIKLLYNPKSKPFKDYVDYVIGKNDVIVELLVALNPDKSIGEMKRGKIFKMNTHLGSEFKFILNLLNALDSKHENELTRKILIDNKEEITQSIFSTAVNVDDKKEKYDFLNYLYKKSPEIIEDIFSNQKEVDELFVKIYRLLKGKPVEKNIACLYLFFVKRFTQSHSEKIKDVETTFPSTKKFSI
jgi:hypothetical protein